MNLTSLRIGLRGISAAANYLRTLDDEKQRRLYDSLVDAVKDGEVRNLDDLKDVDGVDDVVKRFRKGTKAAAKMSAREEAGAVLRASHDRLDRRRAAFHAAADERLAQIADFKNEVKNAPAKVKLDKALTRKKKRGFAGRAAGILALLAALCGAGWALYTYVFKDRLGAKPTNATAPARADDHPRHAAAGERGEATLVYSTRTEDDLERSAKAADTSTDTPAGTPAHGTAGPLGEEPAVRDEALLSSIDEQLSTLDALDDDQRTSTD